MNHSGSFPKGVIPGCNTKTLKHGVFKGKWARRWAGGKGALYGFDAQGHPKGRRFLGRVPPLLFVVCLRVKGNNVLEGPKLILGEKKWKGPPISGERDTSINKHK